MGATLPFPMKQQPPDTRSTTVLNRVAPTVVRRRVVEVPISAKTTPVGYASSDDDDDNGPPSSVNVARALASLRGHELERLEEILSDEDEQEAELAAASEQRERLAPPSLPRVPTVRVGPTIPVTRLAQRLGVEDQELVTALVTHGFFSVTVKTTLPRETARAAATLFGYQIEETDEIDPATPKSRSKPARASASAKADVKAKKPAAAAAKKAGAGAAASAGAAVTRRTSRRA